MSLKHKKNSTPPEEESASSDIWSGPWGRINPTGEAFGVVRFCRGSNEGNLKTHSYPYRVISAWHWSQGSLEEEIKVQAAGDLVLIKGLRLERIVDALDQGTLVTLIEIPGEPPEKGESAVWISQILVEGKEM